MIATRDQDQVIRLAALPAEVREGYLRRLSYSRLMELVNVAQEMRQGGGGMAGLGFFPAIGAFLFSAAKVAGAVGTAAISAGVANALAPKQPAPTVAPAPAPPARQSMAPILIVGGLLLVGVVLLSGGRRRGRR